MEKFITEKMDCINYELNNTEDKLIKEQHIRYILCSIYNAGLIDGAKRFNSLAKVHLDNLEQAIQMKY